MSESDKTTITTATTSTAVTTASSDNVTTPSESYKSSQEGVLKLRLFKNTKTLIDDPEATTSPVIDVEHESHSNITVPPSINLTLIYSSEPTTTSTKKSPFLSISGNTFSRKRKINENEEEEEENEEEKEKSEEKTTLNIKAKKSRRSSLNHQLITSSQPLSTTTTTTAQNFMSFSHNPNPTTHYRASLGSTSVSQSSLSLQQLMTLNNTFISNPSQPLTSRYLTNPQTVTTATIRFLNNPQTLTTAAATNSHQIPISTTNLNPPTHNISLPQPTGELSPNISAFMFELRRVGNIQRKLMIVQKQIQYFQDLLSLLLNYRRPFVRNKFTIRRLDIIASRMTSNLVDLKNMVSGNDAVINPHF